MLLTKDKVRRRTGHEGPYGEYRNSSTFSLTSALDGVGGQRYASADLPPVKTRHPLYRRLMGPRAGLDRCEKSRNLQDFRSPDRRARR